MYHIQANLPSTLSIDLKSNISGLTGEVISSCYYLSIEDYLKLNLTINGVIDTVNLIDHYYTNLDFSTVSGLNTGISEIISSLYVCITLLNGTPISTSHLQNINVLNNFTINNQKYIPNEQNKGDIVLPYRYISGQPSSFVQSFNDRSGDVTGAILQIVINDEIRLMENGLLDLSDLSKLRTHISTIDGLIGWVQVLNQVQYGEDLTLSANSTNRGNIRIESSYFKINNSNCILSDIRLKNVDESNLSSAVTRSYLSTYINDTVNNNLINWYLITGSVITLEPNWYPLHFYDEGGTWLKDVTWTKTENGFEIDNYSDTIKSCSIMKVER